VWKRGVEAGTGRHGKQRGQVDAAHVSVAPSLVERHLARQAVIDAGLGDDHKQTEGERLADHRRRDGPPQGQATVDDGERAEYVHDRVQKDVNVIAKRSRQPTLWSSSGIGSTP